MTRLFQFYSLLLFFPSAIAAFNAALLMATTALDVIIFMPDFNKATRDKTMADKFMYIPNDDNKITPFLD